MPREFIVIHNGREFRGLVNHCPWYRRELEEWRKEGARMRDKLANYPVLAYMYSDVLALLEEAVNKCNQVEDKEQKL